jgi:thiol peroxidase
MKRTTNFKGAPLELIGSEVVVGQKIPDFKLTANDMSDYDASKFAGKTTIILAVPSLDTPTCSLEAKRFNKEATALGENVLVLAVSRDLPFAQKRWCAAEEVEHVVTASDYKYRNFGPGFGALIKDWDLLSRAVFVIDKTGTVQYSEYAAEISAEPNYEAALKATRSLASS